MPRTIIAQMLESLCRSGAVFYYPRNSSVSGRKISTTEVEAEKYGAHDNAELFSENVPGGEKYSPFAALGKSYYPPEYHTGHIEIFMPLQGTPEFFLGESWQRIEDKKVRIILPGTPHTERHCGKSAYTLAWLILLPREFQLYRTAWSDDKGYGQSGYRLSIAPPKAKALWECRHHLPAAESHFFALLAESLDFILQYNLIQSCTVSEQHLALENVRRFLENNFSSRIRMAELARMANYSPIYLNRIFSRCYGISIHKYLQNLRLEEAKRRLKRGEPANIAASASGYEDQRHFCKIFKKATGMTPSEYSRQS